MFYFDVRYAPECIGRGRFSHLSDVWSFGVTLWEIYSYGSQPMYPSDDGTDDNDEKLLKLLVEKKEVLPQPEKCPQRVYEIMLQCWRLDSSDRPCFRQLKEIIDDISRPLTASPLSLFQ